MIIKVTKAEDKEDTMVGERIFDLLIRAVRNVDNDIEVHVVVAEDEEDYRATVR